MKRRSLLILFGFVFGLCGMLCLNFPARSSAQASSTTASVWDGELCTNEKNLLPGEWSYEDGIYHVNSAAALSYFAYKSSQYEYSDIRLETDIDLDNKDWTPIGKFSGTFDGNGHTIFNMKVAGSQGSAYGFFGKTGYNAKIQNLNLRNINISVTNPESDGTTCDVGGLVGCADASGLEIENCSVKGVIDCETEQCNVGGLVGRISSSGEIKKSVADVSLGAVSSSEYEQLNVGGLVGSALGLNLQYSSVRGKITAEGRGYVGGLVGLANGGLTIENSFNAASLTERGGMTMGGLLGQYPSNADDLRISNSYNYGNISWNAQQGNYVGGLIGFAQYNVRSGNVITDSFMAGKMNGVTRQEISPLFNTNRSAILKVQNTYFDSTLAGGDANVRACALADLTYLARTRDFYRDGNFSSDWNFVDRSSGTDGWVIGSENNNFPTFNFDAGSVLGNGHVGDNDQASVNSLRGKGTADEPYLLGTAAELALLSDKTAKGDFDKINSNGKKNANGEVIDGRFYFALENDINLVGKDFVPIGYRDTPFSGVFDGNGHTISQLYMSNQEKLDYQGLFGRTDGAVIKNLKISDFNFLNSNSRTGNLIGSIAGPTYIVNCVDECTTNNTVGIVENGTLYVAYGKNNLSDVEFDGSENTLNLGNCKFTKAYDVTLFSEGGVFYNKNATMQDMKQGMYFGEYHIVLGESGQALGQSFDMSLGQSIPGRSYELGIADIVIKQGYRIAGFKAQDEESLLYSSSTSRWAKSFDEIKQKAVQGLLAVWEVGSDGAGKAVRVVYNAYEFAKMHSTEKPEANYVGKNVLDADGNPVVDFQGDNFVFGELAGQVFVNYHLEYDSLLSESDFLFNVPYYNDDKSIKSIHEGFEMVGLFAKFDRTTGTFSEQLTLEESNVLVNDSLPSELYVQWKGVEDKNASIKFVFKSEDNNLDFKNAISDMTLNFFESSSVLIPQTQKGVGEEIDDGNGYVITFQYSTIFGDRAEKFVNFNLALNSGYRLKENCILFDDGQALDISQIDTNFGTPWTSVSLQSVPDLESFNMLNFFGLKADHQIEFMLERELYQDAVQLSDEGIFVGVGAVGELEISKTGQAYSSNVQISKNGTSSGKIDLIQFLRDCGNAQSEQFERLMKAGRILFSIDIVNGAMIFSTEKYDAIKLDLSAYSALASDGCTIYIHINDQQLKETIYRLSRTRASEGVATYKKIELANETLGKTEVEFWLNEQDSRESFIRYRAFDSFVMMFSTEYENTAEEETASFTDVGAFNYQVANPDEKFEATALKKYGNVASGKTTKFLFRFEDTSHLLRGLEDEAPKIVAVTEYVKAAFEIRFVHINNLDNPNSNGLEKGSPILQWQSVKQVDANGDLTSMDIYVEQSDFFKLFSDDAAKLFNGGDNFNVKIDVEESTLQNGDASSNHAFAEELNNSNSSYFTLGEGAFAFKKIKKGDRVNFQTNTVGADAGTVFGHDGFYFRLNSNISDDKKLQAGRYRITIVFEDQANQVEVLSRVVGQSDVQSGEDALNTLAERFAGDDFEENDSQIETKFSSEFDSETIKFDEVVTFSTQVTSDHGYVFYRWLMRSEDENQIYANPMLSGTLDQFYKKGSTPSEKYKLSAYAVYQRKQARFVLSERAYFKDSLLSASQILQKEISFEMTPMTYEYGTNNKVSNLSLSMKGTNLTGYVLSGYRVFDESGKELGADILQNSNSNVQGTLTEITLDMNWVKDAIKAEQIVKGATLSETFYIVPVFESKKISVHFHSGTGLGQKYGDGKDGHVFDINNNETTEVQYDYDGTLANFGGYLALDALVPNGQTLSIDKLFYSRTGYPLNKEGSWKWTNGTIEGVLEGTVLTFTPQMFASGEEEAELHVYRLWEADEFEIVFHANGGSFENRRTEKTISAIYDTTTHIEFLRMYENVLPVTKAGSEFLGWSLQPDSNQIVLTKDGTPTELCTFFNEDNIFTYAEKIDLYACWESNSYEVEIFFNKAESVPGVTEGESKKYSFTYGAALSELDLGAGLKGINAFNANNVTRNGFIFDGVYALDASGRKVRVTNSFVLDFDFPGFDEDSGAVVSLYFGWRFDPSKFDLRALDSHLPLTYNGEDQNVKVFDYFDGQISKGFVVSDSDPMILLDNFDTIALETELFPSKNSAVCHNTYFTVREAGEYAVHFTVTLLDPMTKNNVLDTYFNLGILKSFDFELKIKVNNAVLDLSDQFEDGLYLQNLKKLVSPYLSNKSQGSEDSLKQRLLAASTLNGAVTVLKEFDTSIPRNVENKDVYAYMMTRFYRLTVTNDSTYSNQQLSSTLLRKWTYQDFLSYKSANSEIVARMIENTYFFGFFDFENQTEQMDVTGYAGENFKDYVTIVTLDGIVPEGLTASRLEIHSSGSALAVGQAYELRVYVTGTAAALKSYSFLEEGKEKYFVARSFSGSVLPQIFTINNVPQDSQVYYSSRYSGSRDMPWKLSTALKQVNQNDYYYIGTANAGNAYLHAEIKSSNIGANDRDTAFNFFNKDNFLYVTGAKVLVGEGNLDITASFKFVIDEDVDFVIKSIKGVAQIVFSAKYLTKSSQNISTLSDLPESIKSNTLIISSVKYSGGEFLAREIEAGKSYTSQDGSLLFEVVSNNANQVEIFVGESVQEVTFSLDSLTLGAPGSSDIGQFVSLFRWVSNLTQEAYTIDGKMETKQSLTITKTEIDEVSQNATNEVATLQYYAIFTDLVKVTYDLNFPEEYQGARTYDSTLKLGEVVDKSILPYEAGLGTAEKLYIREANGVEEKEYTQLNNTVFNAKVVFGGWGNTQDNTGYIYRFNPVTLSARWALAAEIEHEKLLKDEQKVPVYTYFGSTLSVYDMVSMPDTNSNIFDYDYNWTVEYDDGYETLQANSYTINLRGEGGKSATGTYTLKITRKLKQIFKDAHTFENTEDVEVTIRSKIIFMPNLISDVRGPEKTSVTFDGADHRDDIVFNVTYKTFDVSTQDYDSGVIYKVQYSATGLFIFEIKLNNTDVVTSVVNVGDYYVTLTLKDDMFELDPSVTEEDLKCIFQILPFDVDLRSLIETFAFSKQFNGIEPSMEKMVELRAGMVVTLKFSREEGEDIGEYDLFLDDVLADNNKNIVLKYEGKLIFENGEKVEEKIKVGEFVITQSGTLQIDLKGEGMVDGRVKRAYSETATTLDVEQFKLKLQSETDLVLDMLLRDVTKGEDLTEDERGEILDILRDKMSSLKPYFFLGERQTAAKDAGTYFFEFDVKGTALEPYYENVTITTMYRYEITPIEISLTGLKLDKVYDGTNTKIFDIDGKVEGLENFGKLQIEVTYASLHASDRVTISSVVFVDDGSVNLKNYAIVEYPQYAKIEKLDATLTLAPVADGGFEYGAVTAANLSQYLVPAQLRSKSGDSLDLNLLIDGYYDLSFEVLSQNCTNPRGFLFMGEYDVNDSITAGNSGRGAIDIVATFDDFNMEIKDAALTILQKTIHFKVPENFWTITTYAKVAEYYEYLYKVTETGDELDLQFVLVNEAYKTPDGKLAEGKYAVKLKDDHDYAAQIKHSIKVEVDEDNKGLEVIPQTGRLILTVADSVAADTLFGVYDGNEWTITDCTSSSFKITNGAQEKIVTFDIMQDIDGVVSPFESDFTYTASFEQEVRKVGRYKISLLGEAQGLTVVFANDYRFEVTKREIKASKLAGKFNKQYDGSRSAGPISEFEEKISGDSVTISGVFEDANASEFEKKVILFGLGGDDAYCYFLDELETTSFISPAKAKITVGSVLGNVAQFEYGKLTKDNLVADLGLEVTVDDDAILPSLFALTYSSEDITEESFSERGYLQVGTYFVTITADEDNSSKNYLFEQFDLTVEVVARKISLTVTEVIVSVEMGSPEWMALNGENVAYTIPASMNVLIESVDVSLKVEELLQTNNKGVGRYKFLTEGSVSLNKNYILVSVDDKDGGLEITKKITTLYALVDKDDAKDNKERISLFTEYDAREYDNIELREEVRDESTIWKLYLTNEVRGYKKELATLGFYTYLNGSYIKYVGDVKGVSATFTLSQNVRFATKEETPIAINVSQEQSSSHIVRFGLQTPIDNSYDFVLTVSKKMLKFKSNTISETFNNSQAVYAYDALKTAELLDGILSDDQLTMNVTFKDVDGNIPTYSSSEKYLVEATLAGENFDQYEIEIKDINGEEVKGEIVRAKMNIVFYAKTVTYGEEAQFVENRDYYFNFGIQGFDLAKYREAGRKFNFTFEVVGNDELSTTGHLCVGNYCATIGIEDVPECDFQLEFVTINGETETVNGETGKITTRNPVLIVVPRTIKISAKGGKSLQEIFTKEYDEKLTAEIFDGNGTENSNLLFNVSNILSKDGVLDKVKFDRAEFSDYRGVGLLVTFYLVENSEDSKDAKNYVVEQFVGGIINSKKIVLRFEYEKDGIETNVEGKIIEALAYPFLENASFLTSNSYDPSTASVKNFPSVLTGKVGYDFAYWTLRLELSTDSAIKNRQIEKLRNLQSTLGIKCVESALTADLKTVNVIVGNDYVTVRLLSNLIADSENLFDMSYKKEGGLTIVFYENWEPKKFSLRIYATDENGQSTNRQLGTISSDTIEVTTTKAFEQADFFIYDQKNDITLQLTPHLHAKFAELFVNGSSIAVLADLSSGTKELTIDGTGKFTFAKHDNIIYLTVTRISANLNFEVRFRAQKVKVTLEIEDALVEEVEIENNIFDENNVWETDYFAVEDFTLDRLPTLTLFGRYLSAYSVSGTKVSADDFAATKLVKETETEDADIILTPIFEPKLIEVLLDFGYDSIVKSVFVKFQAKFLTAVDEEGQPAWQKIQDTLNERYGFDFVGWFDGEQEVLGSDSLLEESKTLVANWERKRLSVSITLENVNLISSELLSLQENVLVGEEIEFETQVAFTISAARGFELPQTWNEQFDVSFNQNGTANILFVMGGEDFVATISATPRNNIVEFGGELIGEVAVFDTTEEKTAIEDISDDRGRKYFTLLTGRVVTFEVVADFGYDISDMVTYQDSNGFVLDNVSDYGLEVEEEINADGKLVLTISGITFDIVLIFHATPAENAFVVDFDIPGSIRSIIVGQKEFQYPDGPVPATVLTGEELTVTISFDFGFEYGSFSVEDSLDPQRVDSKSFKQNGNDTFSVTIFNIFSDVQLHVTASRKMFTINLQATSYDEQHQNVQCAENIPYALVGDEERQSFTAEYGTQVTLKFHNKAGFEFSGWSVDGVRTMDAASLQDRGFSNHDGIWTLTITASATYWGIFSQGKYSLTLKTMDYSYYTSAGITGIEEEEFVELKGGEYFNLYGDKLVGFELAYGEQEIVVFNVPDGYMFFGYGFKDTDGQFQIIGGQLRNTAQVRVTIDTIQFGTTFVHDLYMFVVSKSTTIQVSSKIDFKGVLDSDVDVGGAELCGKNGETVNEFGYVDGTRVHYTTDSFAGELKDNRNFAIVGYTQQKSCARDEIYLKVLAPRKGYYFGRLEATGANLVFQSVGDVTEEGYMIFRVSGLVGGLEGVEISVIYVPDLHAIEISFQHNGMIAAGGLFEAKQVNATIKKLWTSGNFFTNITVSAFTDVKFSVSAYIRAGFFVDPATIEDCIIDPQNIIVAGSIRYTPLAIKETGFTGLITFDVFNFESISEIQIKLQNSKYTVVFKEDEKVLAKVHDVGFNTSLQEHLLQINAQNIESSLGFVDGHLNLFRELPEHYFVGYFTNQNGSGRQYISSSGLAFGAWLESGYVYNPITGYYELQNGAVVNDDNQIEIPLYVYMSYFKTRIHFEFSPEINTNYTAQDIVSGAEETNMWFYFTNPDYIEIAFNTDIYVTAPQIDGYKFYKFVVNQKTFDGTWLTPVVFYQDKIPWSTNEVDQIVECNIQIYYFAQLSLHVVGGEGTVLIEQEDSDAQAQVLLGEGYFDTSKSFVVTAKPDYGFNFDHWLFNGLRIDSETFEISSTIHTTIYMYLTGSAVTLDFSDYDVQKGQIVNLRVLTMTGQETFENSLVSRIGGRYSKLVEQYGVAVGDFVTFGLTFENEMAVQWNINEITYQGYSGGTTYFALKIKGEYADGDGILKIIPEFSAARRVVYISTMFAEGEIINRALDQNKVESVLITKFGGVPTNKVSISRGADIEIVLEMLPRYEISKIVVDSAGMTFTDKDTFVFDNKIVLNEKFMTENDFGGNIFIQLEISRLMWEDHRTENSKLQGAGTDKDPYRIKTIDDLVLMMKFVNNGTVNEQGVQYRNCSYLLESDINLGEKFWTPIGTITSSFNGTFNFNHHIVRHIGLAVLYEQISYDGLFGVLGSNARIITGESFWWWLILIIVLVSLLILLLLFLIYRNKKKQKDNEEMSTK